MDKDPLQLFRPGQPRLRAAASAVETYIRPARAPDPVRPPATNTFTELASALKDVEPRLNRYLDARFKSYKTDQEALGLRSQMEGAISGIKTNQEAWKTLIDRVRVKDPDEADRLLAMSPHFKRGYQRARADTLGLRFYDELLSEWGTNPKVALPDGKEVHLHQADDPRAMDIWVAERTRAWMEKNGVDSMDPAVVSEVLLPRLKQVQSRIGSRHAEHRLKETRAKYGRELSINVTTLASHAISSGDMAGGIASIQARLDAAVADGLSGKEANKTVVEAIVAEARRTNNPTLLKLLDGITTRDGGKLTGIGWVSSAVTDTRRNIETYSMHRERQRWAREDRARKAHRDKVMAEVIPLLAADATTDLGPFREKLIAAGDAEGAVALDRMGRTYLERERGAVTDDRLAGTLAGRIWTARSMEELSAVQKDLDKAAKDGLLDTGPTGQLYSDLSRARSTVDLRSDRMIAAYATDVGRQVSTVFRADPEVAGVRALEARSLFDQELATWIAAQPTPPSRDLVRAQAAVIMSQVLGNPYFSASARPGAAPATVEAIAAARSSAPKGFDERETMTIASMLSQSKGSIEFTTKTIPADTLADLITAHVAAPEGSLLSKIAVRHGLSVDELARKITGEEHPLKTPEEISAMKEAEESRKALEISKIDRELSSAKEAHHSISEAAEISRIAIDPAVVRAFQYIPDAGEAKITLPADTARELKRVLEALENGDK